MICSLIIKPPPLGGILKVTESCLAKLDRINHAGSFAFMITEVSHGKECEEGDVGYLMDTMNQARLEISPSSNPDTPEKMVIQNFQHGKTLIFFRT